MAENQNKSPQEQAEQRQSGAHGEPESEPDFDAMSHEELMNYAREHGLEGLSSDMTEEEIVQMLRGV